MRFKWLLGIAFCACLFGCDKAEVMKKCFFGCDEAKLMKILTPPDAESSARYYVDLLRQRKFDQIKSAMDPSAVNSNLQDELTQMAAVFPEENPESVKVVGVNVSNGQNYSKTEITLEYQFPKSWLAVSFATQNTKITSGIVKFRVAPLADSLENLYRFTLVGKSPIQYFILIVAAGSFAFSLYVLALCIRTKGLKHKWLWALFILAGVEKVAINWSTGQLTFGILAINFPCFQAMRTPYGPWTIGAFLPLGAILFFNRQRKMKVIDPAAILSVQPTDGDT